MQLLVNELLKQGCRKFYQFVEVLDYQSQTRQYNHWHHIRTIFSAKFFKFVLFLLKNFQPYILIFYRKSHCVHYSFTPQNKCTLSKRKHRKNFFSKHQKNFLHDNFLISILFISSSHISLYDFALHSKYDTVTPPAFTKHLNKNYFIFI